MASKYEIALRLLSKQPRMKRADRCGARTRKGRPCRAPAVWDRGKYQARNGRCKLHGGLSTGQRTSPAATRSGQATSGGRFARTRASRPACLVGDGARLQRLLRTARAGKPQRSLDEQLEGIEHGGLVVTRNPSEPAEVNQPVDQGSGQLNDVAKGARPPAVSAACARWPRSVRLACHCHGLAASGLGGSVTVMATPPPPWLPLHL